MNRKNHDGYIRLSSSLVKVLRQWKKIILVILICSYGFDIFKTMTYKPIYASNLSCYFTKGGNDSYNSLEGTLKYMDSMNYIFNSDMIKEGIAKLLDLDTTSASCYVGSVNGTNYANIQVTANTKREAYYGLQYILDWYKEGKTKYQFSYSIEGLDETTMTTVATNPNNHIKNLAIGAIAGGFIYCAVLFAVAYFSNTIKCANDITKKCAARLYAKLPKESKWVSPLKRNKSILVSDLKTSFVYREALRKLRTRLEESSARHGYKVITVTGSLENEGKSSVAANLSLSLVDNNKKVLLVDCDLRKPSLHLLLESDNNTANINQYLHHQASLASVISAYPGAKLDVIFAKEEGMLAETLLSSDRFKAMIDELRNSKDFQYDYIIIDTPPARFLPDTKIINEFVDGCLLVVRQDLANVKEINETIDLLSNVKENLIGCIYNASVKDLFTTRGRMNRYGYGRYGRGGSK